MALALFGADLVSRKRIPELELRVWPMSCHWPDTEGQTVRRYSGVRPKAVSGLSGAESQVCRSQGG